MGLSHSWIAVKGLDSAQALETLGVEIAGPVEPDYLPQGRGMAELPEGWLLVISDNDSIDELEQLAAYGPAVACEINEHVMYSEARGYADGEEVWRIIHYPEEQGAYGLDVSGSPPAQLQPILQEARGAQGAEGATCDFIFDVPPEVAFSLCGFMLGDAEPESYSQLRKIGTRRTEGGTKPQSQGFFARLFGRG